MDYNLYLLGILPLLYLRGAFRSEPTLPGLVHGTGQAPSLRPRHFSPVLSDPVVAPPCVLVLRLRLRVVHLDDQFVFQHTGERTVERARSELDVTLRPLSDVLYDRISVLIPTGQGEEDMVHRNGKWEVGFRRWSFAHVGLG